MRTRSDDIARARLAYISAGQPPVGGPRRAHTSQGDVLEVALDALEDQPDPAAITAEVAAVTPPASRGGWVFTRRHVLAVLILLAAAVVVAVGVMATSSATPVVVEVPSDVPESLPSEPATSKPPTPPPLRIHVLGAVASPGVVSVPDGSIVQDAIVAAGGLTPDADPARLNLAAPLATGAQVVVGTTAEPVGEVRGGAHPTEAESGSGEGLVDINTATQGQLEELPGVGPVLAGAIIAWRQDNGGFTSVEDLQEVSGIGPKNFERLKQLVTV